METSLQMDTLTIQLPKTDLSFLKSLGKRLGWKIGIAKAPKKLHTNGQWKRLSVVK